MRMLVATALLCATSAHAQPHADNIYAAAYAMSGQQAFSVATGLKEAGKDDQAYDMYLDAIKMFSMAYGLFKTSETAYDVALSYYKIDAPFMAQIWLKRYYKGLRKGEHPSLDADRLATKIVAAIDQFEDEIHYDFRCDEKKQTCHYATNW